MFIRELIESDAFAFAEYVEGIDTRLKKNYAHYYSYGFAAYLDFLRKRKKGKDLPDGFVPDISFFGFIGSKIVGVLRYRLWLNDFLKIHGGHIGYEILPSERGKGFGTQLLLESLKIIFNDLDEVIITCDATNFASKRMIECVGGHLLAEYTNPDSGVLAYRFVVKKDLFLNTV